MDMDQEASLIVALKGRDSGSLEGLIGEYGTRLLRSATLLCGDESQAQDQVQDTFVEAFRSAHRFRGQASLYTWLHSILLNLTRHYRRDSRRLVYDDALAVPEISVGEEPPSALDLASAATELARALQALSEPHREVIVLRFYEHLKIPEIARHLGVSSGTVKSRLHYAIRELQRLFPPEMNLFSTSGTKERI